MKRLLGAPWPGVEGTWRCHVSGKILKARTGGSASAAGNEL